MMRDRKVMEKTSSKMRENGRSHFVTSVKSSHDFNNDVIKNPYINEILSKLQHFDEDEEDEDEEEDEDDEDDGDGHHSKKSKRRKKVITSA